MMKKEENSKKGMIWLQLTAENLQKHMNDMVVAIATVPSEMGEKFGKHIMKLVDAVHDTLQKKDK